MQYLSLEQDAFRASFERVPRGALPETQEVRRQRVEVYREELRNRGFSEQDIDACAKRAWGRDAYALEVEDWREHQNQKALERGILR
jgi:hypothetical protein